VSEFGSAAVRARENSELDDELLRQRAARLRSPLTRPEDSADLFWVARFPLGDELFAFPLRVLRAAIPLRAVTPVPLAPASVIGVLRFEGTLITAFSLASLLGLRSWPKDPTILLVLELEPLHLIAVDSSEVPISIALPARMNPVPASALEAVSVLAPAEGRPIGLIDPSALLAPTRTASHRGG
jgi:chemotaxis signal transduction protein